MPVSEEAVNTKIIVFIVFIVFTVFGLTQPGLEPTIYRTWGKHANHYSTDAVLDRYNKTK